MRGTLAALATAWALAACSDDAATDADAAPGPDALPAFELTARTYVDADFALGLETNLPARDATCLALPVTGAPCGDADLDGLTDAWEDLAIERLRPMLRFDEAEQIVDDPAGVTADIARVAAAPGDPLDVVVILVQAYSRDYGSCGFTAHNGDPERVALHLVAPPGAGPGDVLAVAAYTAAHEDTTNDHGRVFTTADFVELTYADDPVTGDPRWVVFPSADKHATYASLDICESISVVPCFDEDCGPDGVDDPFAFELLPPFVNAGEDGARRVEDLAPLGFAGEDAWADQAFCGGLGTTDECSTKIRDKLVDDPFGVLL